MSLGEKNLSFGGDVNPLEKVSGVPLAEVTRMNVTPCVVCGRDDMEGGMLDDAHLDENGVLQGTSYCAGCAEGLGYDAVG